MNESWIVDTHERRYILRRVNAERSADALAYEHRLLDALLSRGWLVPIPLPTSGGGTFVTVDGRYWVVSNWIEGRAPLPTAWPRFGALLAELNREAEAMLSWGAHPDAMFTPLRCAGDSPFQPSSETLRGMLPAFAEADRSTARRLGEHLDELDNTLVDSPALPKTVVHGDFHRANVRLRRGVAGVLDFEFSRPDDRLSDIATAAGFIEAADDVAGFVESYATVWALSSQELRLLPAYRSARQLLHAGWLLSQWRQGEDVTVRLAATLDRLDAIEPPRD